MNNLLSRSCCYRRGQCRVRSSQYIERKTPENALERYDVQLTRQLGQYQFRKTMSYLMFLWSILLLHTSMHFDRVMELNEFSMTDFKIILLVSKWYIQVYCFDQVITTCCSPIMSLLWSTLVVLSTQVGTNIETPRWYEQYNILSNIERVRTFYFYRTYYSFLFSVDILPTYISQTLQRNYMNHNLFQLP